MKGEINKQAEKRRTIEYRKKAYLGRVEPGDGQPDLWRMFLPNHQRSRRHPIWPTFGGPLECMHCIWRPLFVVRSKRVSRPTMYCSCRLPPSAEAIGLGCDDKRDRPHAATDGVGGSCHVDVVEVHLWRILCCTPNDIIHVEHPPLYYNRAPRYSLLRA